MTRSISTRSRPAGGSRSAALSRSLASRQQRRSSRLNFAATASSVASSCAAAFLPGRRAQRYSVVVRNL